MPSKPLLVGKRYNPINTKFWKRFLEDTGEYVDYKTFCEIIQKTNLIIRNSIVEEEAGIKLPESLGHIIVVKYKSKKVPTDWVNSVKHKKKIPLLNLHSFGYIYHIKWFKIAASCANLYVYKFIPYRRLKRSVAKAIKEGKKYFKWENTDLWSTTKLERRYNKYLKKNNGEDFSRKS